MDKKGISLLSLVITMVVIIILAFIALYSGDRTPELAIRSTFTEEVNQLSAALGIHRAKSWDEDDNENIDFKLVNIENAPDAFKSVEAGSVKGYLIDLDVLNYHLPYGSGTITGDTVKFDVDDVYVYDKNGTVFYAKGFDDAGEIYYNATVHRARK